VTYEEMGARPARRRSGGQRTAAIRQAAFKERRERAGLKRVAVWVPDGAQDQVREFARQLCEHAVSLPQAASRRMCSVLKRSRSPFRAGSRPAADMASFIQAGITPRM
jgi:hypothetical protein